MELKWSSDVLVNPALCVCLCLSVVAGQRHETNLESLDGGYAKAHKSKP